MTLKILALSTSPRTGGNTDILVDQLLEGLKDTNTITEKIQTSTLNIAPCCECNQCFTTGRCVVKDDFQKLYDKFVTVDRLIFATPIYFMTMCAQAKIIVDRCQCFWAKKYVLKQPLFPEGPSVPRRAVVISVGATKGKHLFSCLQQSLRYFFDALEMEYYMNLNFNGIDEKGAIREHSTALSEAFEAGVGLAKP